MNKMMKTIGLGAPLALACSHAFAAQESYKIDENHSLANWSIRYVASKINAGKALSDAD
jgi:hypothetical protein